MPFLQIFRLLNLYIYIWHRFLPYTVHFELDPIEAAEINDSSLGEILEPIKKETSAEDIDVSTGLRIKPLLNPTDDESNLSIIQALSHNASNLSVDSASETVLDNNNFNTTFDEDNEEGEDTDSIPSTSSIVVPKSKHESQPLPLHKLHSPLQQHSSPMVHQPSSHLSHTSNLSSTNSHFSQNVSVQDFFYNNPNKTKMNLSSTSLDDVSSLGDPKSQPMENSASHFNHPPHHYQSQFPHPHTYSRSPSNQNLQLQAQLHSAAQNSQIPNQQFRSPYGQFPTPTFVRPKAQLRNITPQPLVNEIVPKKDFGEPKLSSMRLNRSHNSNLRNLKTASIISLDQKFSSSAELSKSKLDKSSKTPNQKKIMDTYNYDSVSNNYTGLLQDEENEVLNIVNDCNKIAPYGGFSRPHKFTDDLDNIFNTSTWKVVDFDRGNGSLINSIESVRDDYKDDFTWVGTVSIPSSVVPSNVKADISSELSSNYNSNVIFLEDEVFQGHYQSFCKQILWPIFHYQIPDNPKSNAFENHSWHYYEKVNEIFAHQIASKYKKGDTVWVHDYHLMLVPLMLRKLIPDAKIGFFLHVSFPSSEVFRCLAQRKKILEGMLGADCITFQNEEYMAHFLQSSNRLLLADFNSTGVFYNNRMTTVSYNAIGLDYKNLEIQLKSSVVKNWKNLITDRWPNKKLIVSRDKIDKIRGLKEKLLAYERFLDDHPEYISETILILICIQSKSTDEEYKNELLTIAERINSKTKNISIDQPVILLNQDIEFEQYLALLSEANVFIVSTLREGMNLTCHEFICAARHSYSPLILSEFVGSASVLNKGPLLSNPYNIRQVANQIYQCLNMLNDEKIERWNSTFQQILNNDSQKWVNKCLHDIENSCENLAFLQTYNTLEPLTKNNYQNILHDSNFEPKGKSLYVLNLDDITANLEIHGQKIHSFQQQLIQKTLSNLTSNPNNHVYIFSLFQRSELMRLYRRIPDIGLIAENGGIIKPPKSNDWFTVVDESEKAWIPTVVDIVNAFCERIPGSHIDVEECTVVFHTEAVDNIDKDYKEGLIGDLITHINELFAKDFNVHASLTNGKMVVKEMNLIRRALQFILEEQATDIHGNIEMLRSTSSAFTSPVFQARRASANSISQPPLSPIDLSLGSDSICSPSLSAVETDFDFIFACGATSPIDEEIFTFFNNLSNTKDIKDGNIVTVCVGQTGKSRTYAKYSLKGINNLMTLLN